MSSSFLRVLSDSSVKAATIPMTTANADAANGTRLTDDFAEAGIAVGAAVAAGAVEGSGVWKLYDPEEL